MITYSLVLRWNICLGNYETVVEIYQKIYNLKKWILQQTVYDQKFGPFDKVYEIVVT